MAESFSNGRPCVFEPEYTDQELQQIEERTRRETGRGNEQRRDSWLYGLEWDFLLSKACAVFSDFQAFYWLKDNFQWTCRMSQLPL